MLHVPGLISKQMRAFVVTVLSLTYHAIETLQLHELLCFSFGKRSKRVKFLPRGRFGVNTVIYCS